MAFPKGTPTVFYARDKSPLGESDYPHESIENDEPLVNIESDIVGYERNSEESRTPSLDDDIENIAPAKQPLSPEEEVRVEPRGERPAAHPSAVVALRQTRMSLLDTHRESPPLLLHTTRMIPSRQRPRRSEALDAPPRKREP
ncbi:hypothetical protein FCULG_00004245 [Fusarium culmorum]|uniref:Uncharacterized protein n=1 Tax=Fusarium culmorum TaxID=5516 RepID=A0A2T4HC82_FUSCU|nr:hypothetical protein FCULG_00004245 [Fusarium culmorum]